MPTKRTGKSFRRNHDGQGAVTHRKPICLLSVDPVLFITGQFNQCFALPSAILHSTQ